MNFIYILFFKSFFGMTINANVQTISYLSRSIEYVQAFNGLELEVVMPLINYEYCETRMVWCEDVLKASMNNSLYMSYHMTSHNISKIIHQL